MSAFALHAHGTLALEFMLAFLTMLKLVSDRRWIYVLGSFGAALAGLLELFLAFLMLFLLYALRHIAMEVHVHMRRSLGALHVLGATR